MNSFIAQFDDFLNPILVKELRQIVRGKFFWTVFFLYLGILSFVLFITIKESAYMGTIDGSPLAMIMMSILFFVSGLVIPFQIGKKTGDEVNDANNELLFITTMTPQSIANGKFLSGAIMVLMLYSAIAPFLSLTLFMGGIDIRDLLITLVFSFLASNVAVLCQLYAGLSMYNSIGVGTINKFGYVIVHLVVWWTLCIPGAELIQGNFFRYSRGFEFWNIFFWTIGAIVFVGFFFYSLIVSKLQPESSNKMYLFRVVSSILWLFGTVLSIFSPKYVIGWCVVVTVILCFISVQNLLEPDEYSNRILKEIPNSVVAKAINFPFFYGKVNSFCWVLMTAIFTFVYAIFMNMAMVGTLTAREFSEVMQVCLIFLLYINAYGFISNFFRNLFAPTSKNTINITIFTGIVGITTIFYVITLILFRFDDNIFIYFARILTPFGAFRESARNHITWVMVGGILLFVSLLLNSKILLKQIGDYLSAEPVYDKSPKHNQTHKHNGDEYNFYKDPIDENFGKNNDININKSDNSTSMKDNNLEKKDGSENN